MPHIKYLLISTLIFLTACNSSKEPKKTEVKIKTNIIKENNTTVPTPISGGLSFKDVAVKRALDSYLQDLSTFNIDVIVDKTYPRLFRVIDLDLFRQYIASMMNSTDIEILSYTTDILKLSKVTTFSNDSEFAQATYLSTIKLHFLNHNLYPTNEKINFLYDALSHKHGKENVDINIEKRTLQIKKLEKILIIKEKDTEWKFLSDNSKYRQLYPSFLPLEFQKILE